MANHEPKPSTLFLVGFWQRHYDFRFACTLIVIKPYKPMEIWELTPWPWPCSYVSCQEAMSQETHSEALRLLVTKFNLLLVTKFILIFTLVIWCIVILLLVTTIAN